MTRNIHLDPTESAAAVLPSPGMLGVGPRRRSQSPRSCWLTVYGASPTRRLCFSLSSPTATLASRSRARTPSTSSRQADRSSAAACLPPHWICFPSRIWRIRVPYGVSFCVARAPMELAICGRADEVDEDIDQHRWVNHLHAERRSSRSHHEADALIAVEPVARVGKSPGPTGCQAWPSRRSGRKGYGGAAVPGVVGALAVMAALFTEPSAAIASRSPGKLNAPKSECLWTPRPCRQLRNRRTNFTARCRS